MAAESSGFVMTRVGGPGHGDNVMYRVVTHAPDGCREAHDKPLLYLSAEDFDALGSPDEITVIIEPKGQERADRRCSCGKAHATLSEWLAAHGDPGS